jgi:hypothetical protein
MTARTQQARTGTNLTPPGTGTLLPGQLYLEMGTPARLWFGVPPAIDATGRKLLYDADANTAAISGKVNRSGDTMGGPLVLAADPAANMQAATRQYVDAVRTAMVPLAGGTMTGLLLLSGDPTAAFGAATKQYVDGRDALRLPLTGGTLTGALTLAADPAVALGAATKQYVDAKVAGATYPYLPLTGGTVTGALTVNGNTGVGGPPPATANTGTLYAARQMTASSHVCNAYLDNTGGVWRYVVAAPAALLTLGPVGAELASAASGAVGAAVNWNGTLIFDAAGNAAFNKDVNVAGAVTGAGGLIVSGGFGLSSGAGVNYLSFASGYGWGWNTSNGLLTWTTGSNGTVLTVDPAGSVVANGNISAGASVYATAQVRGNAGVFANAAANFGLYSGSGNNYLQFAPSYYWSWAGADGTLGWYVGAGLFWNFRNNDFAAVNNLGVVAGNGAYVNTASDEQHKTDIAPAPHGLDEILAIEPITYRKFDFRTRAMSDRVELGFGARQLATVLPEAAPLTGARNPNLPPPAQGEQPARGLVIEPIVAALVNAVKTLSRRLAVLEGAPA